MQHYDFKDVVTLLVAILSFGGAVLAYLGVKHAGKAAEDHEGEERETDFIAAQIERMDRDRDRIQQAFDACSEERDEVSKTAFENVITLIDIIKRLAYLLGRGTSAKARRNQHEILAIIQYRNFAAKDEVLGELAALFEVQTNGEARAPEPLPIHAEAEEEKETEE